MPPPRMVNHALFPRPLSSVPSKFGHKIFRSGVTPGGCHPGRSPLMMPLEIALFRRCCGHLGVPRSNVSVQTTTATLGSWEWRAVVRRRIVTRRGRAVEDCHVVWWEVQARLTTSPRTVHTWRRARRKMTVVVVVASDFALAPGQGWKKPSF